MSAPWSEKWFEDCQNFHGRVLDGVYRHWCPNGHDLPTDETDMWHFGFCDCFNCRGCGTRMKPKIYALGRHPLEIHEDIFICPNRRFWNFWRHPNRDKHARQWKI